MIKRSDSQQHLIGQTELTILSQPLLSCPPPLSFGIQLFQPYPLRDEGRGPMMIKSGENKNNTVVMTTNNNNGSERPPLAPPKPPARRKHSLQIPDDSSPSWDRRRGSGELSPNEYTTRRGSDLSPTWRRVSSERSPSPRPTAGDRRSRVLSYTRSNPG
eukprot:sb/3472985/